MSQEVVLTTTVLAVATSLEVLYPSRRLEFLATKASDISVSVIVLLSISAVATLLVAKSEAVRLLSATSLVPTAPAAISEAPTPLVAISAAAIVLSCISVPSTVPSVMLSPFIEVIPAPFQLRVVKLPVPAYTEAKRFAVLPSVIVLLAYG